MRRPDLEPLTIWGLALLAVGIGLRVSNAFRYPPNMGFDAKFNWEYIERLMGSWELPAPDAIWASAHPPLFYYLAAAMGRALGHPDMDTMFVAVRLLGASAGLVAVGLAVWLIHRTDPGNRPRALIAGAVK